MDDELGQDLERTLRTALTAAAQIVEQLVRRQREIERLKSQQNRARANELRAQFTAERETARALYARINDQRWWSTATAQQVADAYAAADAWTNFDPRAAAAAEYMREQIQEKWGVAPDALRPTDRSRRRQQDLEEIAEEQRDRTTLQGGALATATQQQIEKLEREAVDVAQEGRSLLAELNKTVDELGQQLPEDVRQLHVDGVTSAKAAATHWEAQFQGWYDAAPDTYTKYRNADWMKESSLRNADEWRQYEADLLERRQLTDEVLGRGKQAAEQLQSTIDVLRQEVEEHGKADQQADTAQGTEAGSRTAEWVQKTEGWHASNLETSRAINTDHDAEVEAAIAAGLTYSTAMSWLNTHAPKTHDQIESEMGWSDTQDGRRSIKHSAISTYVALRRRPSEHSSGVMPGSARGAAITAATQQDLEQVERAGRALIEQSEPVIARLRDGVDHLHGQLPKRAREKSAEMVRGAHQAAADWQAVYWPWHIQRPSTTEPARGADWHTNPLSRIQDRDAYEAGLLSRREQTAVVAASAQKAIDELRAAMHSMERQLEAQSRSGRVKGINRALVENAHDGAREWMTQTGPWQKQHDAVSRKLEFDAAEAHNAAKAEAAGTTHEAAGIPEVADTPEAEAPTYEQAMSWLQVHAPDHHRNIGSRVAHAETVASIEAEERAAIRAYTDMKARADLEAQPAAERTDTTGNASTKPAEATSTELGARSDSSGEPKPKERSDGNRGSHGLQADELPLELNAASGEAKDAAAPGFPGGAYDILAKGGPRTKKIKPRKIRKPGRDNDLGL